MIWARPTWGVWWVWDARLTSTAMLLLFLIGYLAVRRIPADPDTRARRSAIIGLLLLPNVFIVNRSVTWWRSLHQGTTILNTLQPKIHDQMAFTLVFSIGVCALVFAWLFIHRWRLTWLEEQLEAHELDEALIERRAEAGADGAAASDRGPHERLGVRDVGLVDHGERPRGLRAVDHRAGSRPQPAGPARRTVDGCEPPDDRT